MYLFYYEFFILCKLLLDLNDYMYYNFLFELFFLLLLVLFLFILVWIVICYDIIVEFKLVDCL